MLVNERMACHILRGVDDRGVMYLGIQPIDRAMGYWGRLSRLRDRACHSKKGSAEGHTDFRFFSNQIGKESEISMRH